MNIKKSNKGFTLVELIVVLVILAILAAVLIPALLGYIDEAKSNKDIIDAKNCLTMIQTELTKLYAKNGDQLTVGNKAKNTIVGYKNVKGAAEDTPLLVNGNVNATETAWSRNILYELELKKRDAANNDDPYEPYCVMFGVGSNVNNNTNASKHDKYTVFFLFYMETENSTPLWYFNGEWRTTRPTTSEIDNSYKIKVGDKNGMQLQFYFIANKTGKNPAGSSTFMNWYNSLK